MKICMKICMKIPRPAHMPEIFSQTSALDSSFTVLEERSGSGTTTHLHNSTKSSATSTRGVHHSQRPLQPGILFRETPSSSYWCSIIYHRRNHTSLSLEVRSQCLPQSSMKCLWWEERCLDRFSLFVGDFGQLPPVMDLHLPLYTRTDLSDQAYLQFDRAHAGNDQCSRDLKPFANALSNSRSSCRITIESKTHTGANAGSCVPGKVSSCHAHQQPSCG